MEKDILELLDRDGRLSVEQIALMLDKSNDEVFATIAEMEEKNVICGYNALINWDKTDKEFVNAMIEVKITPQRDFGFEKVAQRISLFDEVKSVYLMSGGYDILVMLEGKTIKEVAYFVSNKLSTLDAVLSTATHFVLKRYKEHGVALNADDDDVDERMIVSP